jgi:hypothetical protein
MRGVRSTVILLAFTLASTQVFAWCAGGYDEYTDPCDASAKVCVAHGGAAPPSTCASGGSTNNNSNSNANSNSNSNSNRQHQSQNQSQIAEGGQGGKGGAGGNGSAVAIVSTGPSTSSATTGPSQSYSQGGNATVGNLSTGASTSTSSVGNLSTGASTSSVDGSGNGDVSDVNIGGNTYQAQARNPVNTAYAPTVITGSDQCLVTVAVGAQGVMFGVTFGTAKRDENCELMKLADRLKFLGRSDVAIKLLSQDERVAKALREANDERAPHTTHREPQHTADIGRQFDGRTLECSGAGCADR